MTELSSALDAARASVHRNLPDIVKKLIEHVLDTGSYLHARFLFEFAGISAPPPPPEGEGDDSLARLLLKELDAENPN